MNKNCPFCRNANLHVLTQDETAFVECKFCYSRGPRVRIGDISGNNFTEEQAISVAWDEWNYALDEEIIERRIKNRLAENFMNNFFGKLDQ